MLSQGKLGKMDKLTLSLQRLISSWPTAHLLHLSKAAAQHLTSLAQQQLSCMPGRQKPFRSSDVHQKKSCALQTHSSSAATSYCNTFAAVWVVLSSITPSQPWCFSAGQELFLTRVQHNTSFAAYQKAAYWKHYLLQHQLSSNTVLSQPRSSLALVPK